MSVSPVEKIVPRTTRTGAPSVRPVPKPKPIATGAVGAALIVVEGDLFGASVELVYQRDDLREAISDTDAHALERAERALDDGDYVLCRELIRVARFAIANEDAAARRAETRREAAHGHQKDAAGRIERLVTVRGQSS